MRAEGCNYHFSIYIDRFERFVAVIGVSFLVSCGVRC